MSIKAKDLSTDYAYLTKPPKKHLRSLEEAKTMIACAFEYVAAIKPEAMFCNTATIQLIAFADDRRNSQQSLNVFFMLRTISTFPVREAAKLAGLHV